MSANTEKMIMEALNLFVEKKYDEADALLRETFHSVAKSKVAKLWETSSFIPEDEMSFGDDMGDSLVSDIETKRIEDNMDEVNSEMVGEQTPDVAPNADAIAAEMNTEMGDAVEVKSDDDALAAPSEDVVDAVENLTDKVEKISTQMGGVAGLNDKLDDILAKFDMFVEKKPEESSVEEPVEPIEPVEEPAAPAEAPVEEPVAPVPAMESKKTSTRKMIKR